MVKVPPFLALLVVISICALAAGCATQPPGNATTTVPTTRPTTVPLTTVATIVPNATPDNTTVLQPTVDILSPANGATIPPGNITTLLRVSHFSIAPNKIGEANARGEGHVHYFLDNPAFPTNTTGWSDNSTFTNVTAGVHTITVQLVNNDHTPYVPPASANSTFTVAP